MKRRWNLFTYPTMDIKAAEAMLNRQAEQGWRLEKVWLGLLASFVPAKEPVCYCIDWYDPNREDGTDYRTLLADAGWTLRRQTAYRNIYEAPAGTQPIQSDSQLEYQRFRKKVLRRMGIGAAVVAIYLLVMLLLILGTGGWDWMATAYLLADSDLLSVMLPLLPLILVGGGAWLLRMVWRLWQWNRAIREGQALPVPGRRSAAVAKVCSLGGWIVLLIFLVAILLDVLGKRYPVSTLAGFTVGSLIVLFKFQGEEYRRRRRYGVAMLVVCLTALVAMLVLPEGLTDPIHVQPPAVLREPLEEMQEQGDPAWGKEESSLLLYHSSWHRYGAPDEWLQVEVWTARGDRLADWVWQQTMRELRENGTPEAEGTDVWRVMLGENDDLWLLRRGTTVLWLEGSEGFLTPLLAQLQEVEL